MENVPTTKLDNFLFFRELVTAYDALVDDVGIFRCYLFVDYKLSGSFRQLPFSCSSLFRWRQWFKPLKLADQVDFLPISSRRFLHLDELAEWPVRLKHIDWAVVHCLLLLVVHIPAEVSLAAETSDTHKVTDDPD